MQTEQVSRHAPTLRQRSLARELKRLREEAGLTLEAAGAPIEVSRATLSRYENCQIIPRVTDVVALLDRYGVEGPHADALIEMARNAKQREWWARYSDVLPAAFSIYLSLERDAGRVSTFESELIPGLLQTEAYARAIFAAAAPCPAPAEIERRLALRMERQQQRPGRLHVILGEGAVCRMVGSPLDMAEQLEHLIVASREQWLTLQVLPFTAGAHSAMGSSFSVLEFTEQGQPPVLYCDTASGGLYVEGEQAQQHLIAFGRLHEQALAKEATAMHLADRAARFRKAHEKEAAP